MTFLGFAAAGCESQAVAGCVDTAGSRGAPGRPEQLTPLAQAQLPASGRNPGRLDASDPGTMKHPNGKSAKD
jgi:hypothetical protein